MIVKTKTKNKKHKKPKRVTVRGNRIRVRKISVNKENKLVNTKIPTKGRG